MKSYKLQYWAEILRHLSILYVLLGKWQIRAVIYRTEFC